MTAAQSPPTLIEQKPTDERLSIDGSYTAYYGVDWTLRQTAAGKPVKSGKEIGLVMSWPQWTYTRWRCKIRPPSDGRQAGIWWIPIDNRPLTAEEIQHFTLRISNIPNP